MNAPPRGTYLTTLLAFWMPACALTASEHVTAGGDGYIAGPQTPAIRVLVLDRARVGENTLTVALDQAGRLFRGVGVRLTWVRCPAGPIQPVSSPECGSLDASMLVLRIIGRPAGEHASLNALGFAVTVQGDSVYATVFHDRVLAIVAFGGPCSEGVLLGHAIAHELGHLLLGPSAHSHYGLMAGRWRAPDLDRAAVGLLQFSPGEAARLRTEALRRGHRGGVASAADSITVSELR